MVAPGTQVECGCRFYRMAPDHHDLLLELESASFDQLTSVVELAVTWLELDYSEARVIGPEQWLDFVSLHRWQNEERVTDFFLAVQGLRAKPAPKPELAVVLPLEDSETRRCDPNGRAAAYHP